MCYDEVVALRKASVNVENSLEKTRRESSQQMLQINNLQSAGKDYMNQIVSCAYFYNLSLFWVMKKKKKSSPLNWP